MEVMPPGSGHITMGNAPLHGVFNFGPLPDGTHCQVEFDLWSSDTADVAEKLKSSNWTGLWLNEATEVPFGVMSAAKIRGGRYPAAHLGGIYWSGLIMDFNRPPKGHWLWGLFGKENTYLNNSVYPIASFVQPPAAFCEENEYGKEYYIVNPEAENLENLAGGVDYYQKQIALLLTQGKTDEIKSLYCLLETESKSGRAVWPMFDPSKHVARTKIEPLLGEPLLVGCDPSGIHPAAVLAQYQQGRWCITDELAGDEEGLDVFLHSGLIPLIKGRYSNCPVTIVVDPANARDAYTGLTPTTHMASAGFTIAQRTTNRPETRIAAVSALLNINIGGLLISPHCEYLIDAMKGADGPNGYHYTKHRLRGSIESSYSPSPEKNAASHLADSLQYLALHINRESAITREPEVWMINQSLVRKNTVRQRIMRN
jgi:hypothetical protein